MTAEGGVVSGGGGEARQSPEYDAVEPDLFPGRRVCCDEYRRTARLHTPTCEWWS